MLIITRETLLIVPLMVLVVRWMLRHKRKGRYDAGTLEGN
jgi:cbb3-type cytochrome oxidase subunit 3